MLTLCMDTSHKFLTITLLKNYEIIYSYNKECFKKQSEMIFPILEEMIEKTNIKPTDINEIVISDGPGSYTGVRIAMSIAKTMAALKNIPVYTIDTLLLYSFNKENTAIIMDARSNRCYIGVYDKGKTILKSHIININKIKEFEKKYNLCGDLSLIGKEDLYYDTVKSFVLLKKYWNKVDNIHLLTPKYLKESDEYLVK